jgi:hypothetical protein
MRLISRSFLQLLVAFVAICVLGCGGGKNHVPAAASDPAQARETLIQVLDAWKSGAASESLAAAQPATYVGDEDWTGGKALAEYKVVGDAEQYGNNVRFQVELILKSNSSSTVRKAARYTVATSPVRNVLRDDS